MLDDERMMQMTRQAQARRDSFTPLIQIAIYRGRDKATGDRILELPDGGEIRSTYISNSDPDIIPTVTVPSMVPGLPGFTGQKPS